MKKDAIKLTIFTPTYNRAELLKRGYDALCRQTNKKFIWMIVDDGSTDNTAQTVEEWTGIDKGFEIIYIKKELILCENICIFKIYFFSYTSFVFYCIDKLFFV